MSLKQQQRVAFCQEQYVFERASCPEGPHSPEYLSPINEPKAAAAAAAGSPLSRALKMLFVRQVVTWQHRGMCCLLAKITVFLSNFGRTCAGGK